MDSQSKIPTTFFTETEKYYPKIYIEQKTPDSQSNAEKKYSARIIVPHFKVFHRT